MAKVSLSTVYKANNFFKIEIEHFKEKGKWRIKEKNRKEVFLTALAMVIKKDSTPSIRKHSNELKILEKTGRTVIIHDYVIYGRFRKQNKCIFPSKYWFT